MTRYHIAVVALVLGMLVLMLSGCATPKERIRTVEVRVPVSVPCKPTIPPAEPYAASSVDLRSDIFTLVQALLVEREQRKAREAVLTAATEACK